MSNIEIIEVSGFNTTKLDVDTTATTGVTDLNIVKAAGAINADAGSTTNVTVNMKAANKAVDIDGGKDVTVKLTDVAAAADVVTIGTDTDAGGADVGVAAAGNVVVEMTGKAATANATLSAVTVTGGKTISVTQKATSDSSKATTDTTGFTITQGAVTVNADNTTTSVTVNQTANATVVPAVEAKAAVAGTQVVTFTAMTVGQTVTVHGLTFTAAKSLTAAEVAAAFSNISATTHLPTTTDYQSAGGTVVNGTYSGQLTNALYTTGAATGATVTFSEVTATATAPNITVAGTATATAAAGIAGTAPVSAVTGVLGVTTGTVTIADNATKSITTVSIDGYATANLGTGGGTNDLNALTTLSLANGLSTGTATVVTNAATLGLTLNNVQGAVTLTDTALKTLNITTAVKDSSTALTASVVETLNVTGTNLVSLTNDLAALKTVTVSGTAGLTLDAATANTITSINTTATTGTVTATIDAGNATYTGGAGVDNVTTTTTTAPTKAINLGAGNDTITLASGTTAMGTAGTINGGDGTDTLSMLAADASTTGASANTTFAGKVTNFEQLTLTGATGNQTVDAAKLGNYNYVTVTAGAAAAATTTLTGLTSGATIALNDANDNTNVNDTIVATIKDATLVANTSDVLNIAISAKAATAGAVADDNGTVTAAGVETINISVLDAVNEATVVGAAVGTKNAAPDTQNLKLQATSAKTITITGDTALNLTNTGNIAVSLIDASTMTGNLTVKADGLVASTIKGGSGNDVLTASDTLSIAAVAQVSTVTLSTFDAGDTITINGIATAGVSVVTGATATATVDLLVTAINTAPGKTVTAVNDAGVLKLTADVAGTAFTATAAVADTDTDTPLVTTATIATPVPNAAATGLATTANILEGGAGNDSLTANAGMVKMYGGAGNDTFNITSASINVNSAATIMDLSSGDVIKFAGADSFKAAGITLDSTAVFQDYANAAIASITTNNDLAWFQFSGNTYIIQEKDASTNADVFVNAQDFVVKINGLVDLSTASFNTQHGTLEIA